MGISYDIVDSNNQIVGTFGLKWFIDYSNIDSIDGLQPFEIIDYCDRQIEIITKQRSELFENYKLDIIDKIKICKDLEEISDVIIDRLDGNLDRLDQMQYYIDLFKRFQNFLVPYIWDQAHKYRGEISF